VVSEEELRALKNSGQNNIIAPDDDTPLMTKHCLTVIRNRNLRQEICPHVAVKV